MENSYWNESGKHQDFFDKALAEAPSFGFTNNIYMNALIAMSNVYFDICNNGGCNIEDLYKNDFYRYASRFVHSYHLEDLMNSYTDLAEQAMDQLLEQLQNKPLNYERYTVWWSYKDRVLSLVEPFNKSFIDWSTVIFGDMNQMHAWCSEQVSFNNISDITEEVIFMNQAEKANILQNPDICYTIHPDSGDLVLLIKGKSGYFDCDWNTKERDRNVELADHLNRKLGITQAQISAMEFGSMFGWDKPGADPKNYVKPTLNQRICSAQQKSFDNVTLSGNSPARPLANER